MKPLKKVGKDEPRGWEQPDTAQQHFPIIPEPADDNELPVPYYDSDDHQDASEDEGSAWNYESDYTSDGSVDVVGRCGFKWVPPAHNNSKKFKTTVRIETDFLEE